MAFGHGTLARLYVHSLDMSGYTEEASITYDVDMAEAKPLNASYVSRYPGHRRAGIGLTGGGFDATAGANAVAAWAQLGEATDGRPYAFMPAGDAHGRLAHCGTIKPNSSQVVAAGDDIVRMPVGYLTMTETDLCRILRALAAGGSSPGATYDSAVAELGNTGFETLGAGAPDIWASWTEAAGDGTLADTATAQAGTHAVMATAGATKNTQVSQLLTVVPGREYFLTFYTRGDATYAGRYSIYDETNGADIVAVVTTGVIAATYAQVTKAFTAPEGCTSVSVHLWCPSTTGGISYFDEVYLRERNGGVYLLCTAISGADATLTVTFQHSWDNTTWETLVAMTALLAAGSEVKSIVTGIGRYVRVSWTLTGTTPAATWFAALGRRE